MREILFRGKQINTENQMWKYGDFLHNGYDYKYAIRDKKDIGVYEVIPETVGQFTGLTDKNGTKIFEGDILKGRFYGFPVIKDDFVFSVSWQDDVKGFKSNYFEANLCEVIGNIYDNPELLNEV